MNAVFTVLCEVRLTNFHIAVNKQSKAVVDTMYGI